jgi:hypothetical protein
MNKRDGLPNMAESRKSIIPVDLEPWKFGSEQIDILAK